MTEATGRFQDLLPRVLSGLVLAGVGAAAIWAGGWWFLSLVAVSVGLMVWELQQMLTPAVDRRFGAALGGLAGGAVFLTGVLPAAFVLPLALLPSVAALGLLRAERTLFAGFSALIVLAGFGLQHMREDFGAIWLLWLLLVVIITDIGGYFAGRLIGGPKLWPRVSPKKTWSGTVAGWIAAAAVGAAFMSITGAGVELLALSVALSMASQLGDVSESAIKRHAGVKDSSRLIPGHGGLMDRFDGMLGAAIMLLLVERVVAFPPVTGG
jgi:phosphatidate cytidylyltransferase